MREAANEVKVERDVPIRVRVQVSSGAHPVFARHLGTGDAIATATTPRPADQAVFHEPAHLSWVSLPHLLP